MNDDAKRSHDAVTTPVGVTTICPQCGVVLDAITTTCGACGAVITDSGAGAERSERVRAKLQNGIGEAFLLGDMLGRGGLGIVFRARETALDRDVALKVLAFDPILNPDAYARFEREAKLAARLDHPNIVPIFSVGQRNGIAFYTMRMVRGGSVEQMITPGRGLDVTQALAILRDVASALDYAHLNGVVHRDIKPANVLVGDSGHALVADFGIARAFGNDTGGATATGTGVVGSPAYMSPEQWRGEKVDGRADQYALAILAFELLSGQRPFADASMQELLRMHLTDRPPEVSSLRGELPPAMSAAIARGMSKQPEDRFASATAFVEALGASSGVAASPVRTPFAAAPVTGSPAIPSPSAKTVRKAIQTGRVSESTAVRSRSLWPAAALLLVLGGVGGAIVVAQRGIGRAPKSDVALPVPVVQAPLVAAPANDSLLALEREQGAEIAALRRDVEDARTVAMASEHRRELAAAKIAAADGGATVEPVHAHLFVMVKGGVPAVLVDGRQMADRSPAVIEVPPGHHAVTVRSPTGSQKFLPAVYDVDLAANDTEQVVFMSAHAAAQAAKAEQRSRTGAVAGVGAPSSGTAVAPDSSTLTPQQRQRWQQYLRRINGRKAVPKP
jgi:serine/threonine protein kinase